MDNITLAIASPYLIIFGYLIFKLVTKNYLSKKLENLATKQDIGEITDIVESVKNEYESQRDHLKQEFQLFLNERDRQHQLSMAALDRRLVAHQEAFTLWRALTSSVNRPKEVHKMVLLCQDWWNNNCLYLSSKSRDAFIRAYNKAHIHHMLIDKLNISHSDHDNDAVTKNWDVIESVGDILAEDMSLPPFAHLDIKNPLQSDVSSTD